jgi:hypothetical protein
MKKSSGKKKMAAQYEGMDDGNEIYKKECLKLAKESLSFNEVL